eukprot:gene24848-30281_t
MGGLVEDFVVEVVFTFIIQIAFNSIRTVSTLLRPSVEPLLAVDDVMATLELSLFFVALSFFFSPFWSGVSRGAATNPAGLIMKGVEGRLSPVRVILNCAGIIIGNLAALLFVEEVIHQAYPLEGVSIQPLRPDGDVRVSIAYEFVVTAIVFGVGAHAAKFLGAGFHTTVFNSALYCAILAYEQCTYSCSIVNPAAALSLQLHSRGAASLFSGAVLRDLAPYLIGSTGGAMFVGFMHALFAARAQEPASPTKKLI